MTWQGFVDVKALELSEWVENEELHFDPVPDVDTKLELGICLLKVLKAFWVERGKNGSGKRQGYAICGPG